MRMAQVVLLPALILSAQMLADAQLIRSGDLPNLAEGATAAASTSAPEDDGKFGPPMAVDGSASTRWVAGGDLPQWLELTFAEPITLDTVIVQQAEPGIYPRFPRAGHICARRTGEKLSSTYATVLEPGSRIASAERLEADRAGGVGVRAIGQDGAEDRLLSAPDDAMRDYGGGFAAAAQLARIRSDADGLVEANLLAGTELRTPWLTLRLPQAAWRATVAEVDEASREVVLDVEGASLPEGDVLRGAAVYFSNPAYSRNIAYHVESVNISGDQVRLRVREATFLLGKAVIYGTPADANTLTSIIPHDYARTMARGGQGEAGDFFAGKLLIGPDGAATTIREVNYGQPQTIRVASTAGFSDGDECWYQDVQPGDEVVIHAQATLSRTGAGTYRITANTPVTVEAQGEVLRRAGNAEWLPAEDAIPRGR